MQSKSGNGNQVEPNPHAIPPTNVYTEPWWRGIGYNPISAVPQGNASNSSSLEGTNGASESNCVQSQSEEDDDATKDSQPHPSVGHHGQEQHMHHVSSTVPAMRSGQPPQLELVGHSIACASNPYQDPYFGGMVAAYGHQPLGYPPFVGIPQGRMPLTLEMTQEPVYVNAKQYQGILRRRQARAKAELERKLIKARKPYLHESRHQHAMRRARGNGGRFAKKSGNDSAEEKGTGPRQSHSATSSGSEPLHSDSAETWNYQNGSGNHHSHSGLQSSTYSSAQRPLAIQ